MSLRVFIVDDELPAREELQWLLGQCEGVDIVGQAAAAQDAIDGVSATEPELVFLDIDMPGVSGMRLAELFRDTDDAPAVVFVTAHEHHAVDAFAVEAVDYLLKPVRLDRLQKSLERVRKHVGQDDRPAKVLNRISVNEKGVYRVIPVEDILFFESEDGVVVVQTRDSARFITDFSLKFLEENLDPEIFFRSHRSYIVRLDAIQSIAPWGAGTYRLILDRNDEMGVPLARSRAADLKALIPWSTSALDD